MLLLPKFRRRGKRHPQPPTELKHQPGSAPGVSAPGASTPGAQDLVSEPGALSPGGKGPAGPPRHLRQPPRQPRRPRRQPTHPNLWDLARLLLQELPPDRATELLLALLVVLSLTLALCRYQPARDVSTGCPPVRQSDAPGSTR